MSDLPSRFAFLTEACRLKTVERANVLMDLSRAENSAEHSWHVALYGLVFGLSDRALAMILLHDLVEIDCGDHPIHLAHDWAAVQAAEDAAAVRLFGMLPDGAHFLALWREYEAGETEDARAARRMDHVQPLFQVLQSPTPLPAHLEIARDNLDHGRCARLRGEWPEIVAAAEALMAGTPVEGDLGARLAFLAEADALKSVLRATRIAANTRRENSAEHSWHLALYALVLAGHARPEVEIGRVVRMLLLHDLVEIDTGDVPIHAQNGAAHHSDAQTAAEAAAAARLFGLLPPLQGAALRALWTEFEGAATPDAQFAKALDRCQPLAQNMATGGGTWVEYEVTFAQVESRVGRQIIPGAPQLWAWLSAECRPYFAQ